MGKLIKKSVLIALILILVVTSGVIYLGYRGYSEAIDKKSLIEKVSELKQTKNYTDYEEIAPVLLEAVVSIEDHRFYSHEGIDYISLIRVSFANLMAQDIVGGGSTITQQLAKGFYFDNSPSFTRKISEAFVANDIENKYEKEAILEMYVNHNYYGDGFYGIHDASIGYFNVLPKDLTIAQASMLAGLPQAPSNYALSNHYDKALQRQGEVLQALLEHKKITKQEYKEALATQLK